MVAFTTDQRHLGLPHWARPGAAAGGGVPVATAPFPLRHQSCIVFPFGHVFEVLLSTTQAEGTLKWGPGPVGVMYCHSGAEAHSRGTLRFQKGLDPLRGRHCPLAVLISSLTTWKVFLQKFFIKYH